MNRNLKLFSCKLGSLIKRLSRHSPFNIYYTTSTRFVNIKAVQLPDPFRLIRRNIPGNGFLVIHNRRPIRLIPLCFFIVCGGYHRRRLGTSLFQYILQATKTLTITVNTSPFSVPFYRAMGFVTDDERTENSIQYRKAV